MQAITIFAHLVAILNAILAVYSARRGENREAVRHIIVACVLVVLGLVLPEVL